MDTRLIIDPPASGSWNMAVDEAMLHSLGRAGQGGCLRFYFWDQPTLSLGYFQSHGDRARHAASRECPLVRRSTGGGAIVHADELTYSFAVPAASLAAGGAAKLYAVFHESLVSELSRRGVQASLCSSPPRRGAAEEPFLCFLRRAEGDVLVGDRKVAGSAQRRHRLGLLQHGSILLKSTSNSPELAGIAELAGVPMDPRELAARWALRLGSRLGLRIKSSRATEAEVAEAETWCRYKFSNPKWNEKR